jgi:hypothetical protein
MNKIINIVSALPFLIALGAVALFILGYVSHSMVGRENPIEEIAEELLKKEYNIDIEFSGGK